MKRSLLFLFFCYLCYLPAVHAYTNDERAALDVTVAEAIDSITHIETDAYDLIKAEKLDEAIDVLKNGLADARFPEDKKKIEEVAARIATDLSGRAKKSAAAEKYRDALAFSRAAYDLFLAVKQTREVLGELATIADCEANLHDYPSAIESYSLLLELFESIGNEHVLVGYVLEARAKVYDKMLQPDAVLKDILRAAAIYEKAEGKGINYQNSLSTLASAYIDLYRYKDAERVLNERLELQRASSADFSERGVASTIYDLAKLKRLSGRFSESEQLFLQLISISDRLAETEPAVSFDIRTVTLDGLGKLYNASGRFAEAERTFKLLVSLYENGVDQEKYYAASLISLCDFYSYIGKFDEAIAGYRKAIKVRERLYGPDSLEVLASLKDLANVLKMAGKYSEANNLFEEILPAMVKVVGEKSLHVADLLNDIARLNIVWGQTEKAQRTAQQALKTAVALYGEDSYRTADYRNTLAQVFKELGKFPEAEEQCRLTLSIAEKTFGTRHSQYAWSLRGLGMLLRAAARYEEAEDVYRQALAIDETIYGVDSVRSMANRLSLGKIYAAKGATQPAEEQFQKVMKVYEETYGSMNDELTDVLQNLAFLHMNQGRFSEALQELERAVAINKSIFGEDHYRTTDSLEGLAVFHRRTGNFAKAEECYRKSLAASIKFFGSESHQAATTLHNLAVLYYNMGTHAKAVESASRAIAIYRKFYGGDHQKSANTMSVLGINYVRTGNYDEAERLFKTSIALNASVKNDDGWAEWGLAELYVESKRYAEALPLLKSALNIAQKEKDSEMRWRCQASLSLLMQRTGRIDAAIFFGKQAVNTIQEVRGNLVSLGKDVQASYQDTVTPIYKKLADMLIEQGRLPEAQQVMDLLKQQEYLEFVRRDAGELSGVGVTGFTARESLLDKAYQDATVSLARIVAELDALLGKKNRTEPENKRLEVVKKEHADAVAAFNRAFDAMTTELQNSRSDKIDELKEAEGLMSVLKELKQGSVAIYTLVGDNKFRSILITPRFRKSFEFPVSAAELNQKIARFRSALTSPTTDPRPIAQELYRIIVGPMAEELRESKAQTLMWSLDGCLRYLPVAALHDGRQYLVQMYRNVIFTSASQANLKDVPSGSWKGLAMGVSKEHPGFSMLPSVPFELASIIRTDASGQGTLPGDQLLDERFTWESMEDNLRREETYPLVHIASHFQFTPGNDLLSFLLLGDGRKFTISELKSQDGLFSGVELLTLSACNTAVGDVRGADGKEVEAFAVLAQRKGAKSVLASLWPVADDSTAYLMGTFYKYREQKNLTKAEALRQAQLALLDGSAVAAPDAMQRGVLGLKKKALATGDGVPFRADPAKPYAHPYFWAPFVLMGNWK